MSVLTRDELGDEQYAKAHNDRMRFRGSWLVAKVYAGDRGAMAAAHLVSLNMALANDTYSETARSQFANDAALFARSAFKGWRAYRLMKGE